MIDRSPLFTWISRNMLLPVTGFFIAGATGAGQITQISMTIVSSAALVLALIFTLLQKKLGLGLSLLMIFFLILGFIHTHRALQPPVNPSHIFNRIPEKTLVTLDGVVTGMVSQGEEKSRFELELNTIITRKQPSNGEHLPTTGRIRLSMRGQAPQFLTPGQRILAVATVDRIKNYQTPGTFDYALYMHSKGIYSSGWISSSNFIEPVSKSTDSVFEKIRFLPQKIRQKIGRFIQSRCDPVAGGLYQALLIGDRSTLSSELHEQFAQTGCMHLLAISGLHMGLLALLIYGLLTWVMKRSQWLLLYTHIPTLTLSLSFPILFLYAFIAGMNTPVFRSLLMAAILLAAVLIRRQHSILHLIAAAALLTLILYPLALFTVSFQLSFVAILAIALVYPKLLSLFVQREADPAHKNKITGFLRWPLTAFFISLAATAGTLPLLLYHFNRFSPIGPLMNLLIEPLLCFIALPLGLIAIPLMYLSPDLAASFLQIGGVALRSADVLTQKASLFPFASVWTIRPSVFEIILYYSLLIFAFTYTQRRKAVLLSLFSILLALHFTTEYPFSFSKTATISYLDVGQGTATLLELPNGTNILLDGGGNFSKRFNVGKNIIAPFLWHKRIRHINAVIITHPDSDHYNGLDFIIKRFHPQIVYTNGESGQPGKYKSLLEGIAQKNISTRKAVEKDVLHNDSLCRLTCLGMPGLPVTSGTENDQSLVLRLQCGTKSFLFPGDIEDNAEALLVQRKIQVQADVLLAPHHGSKTSCSKDFLNAVAPQLIIVSAGRTKQGIFPAPVHQTWWRQNNIAHLVTGIDGTVTCRTDGEMLQILH